MKTWKYVLGVVAVTLAAAAIAGTCGVKSEEIASWVQAVGSVVAIVAAFMVANDQERERTIKEAEDQVAVAQAAHLLTYRALELVGDRLSAAILLDYKQFRYRLRGSRTTEMIAAMREFETHRLPSPLLSDFILLRSQIYAINERLSEVYATEKSRLKPSRRPERPSRLESAQTVYREAVQTFASLERITIVEFGASPQPQLQAAWTESAGAHDGRPTGMYESLSSPILPHSD